MPDVLVAAVDIGETNQRVAIVGADGTIHASHRERLTADTPAEVLKDVASRITDLADGAQLQELGMVLPGGVDTVHGRVIALHPLVRLRWNEISVPELIGQRLAVPVIVENDANAAAIGEGSLGVAAGLNDYVFLALGTAIGAGVVISGRLHRGTRFVAGEVGYFPMTRGELHNNDWQHVLAVLVGGGTGAARRA